ncbi:hypothetical protein C0Q70_20709 [Pomacea canaliculata]|uniref:Uncharacterized protein n=1 Tax=Pomacea canaliculata TaxID=400727 RepID=A0A2T7NGA6_POMCA|nr:hypothetical protein C0Q70_20709 [Pomacea canaliculata]
MECNYLVDATSGDKEHHQALIQGSGAAGNYSPPPTQGSVPRITWDPSGSCTFAVLIPCVPSTVCLLCLRSPPVTSTPQLAELTHAQQMAEQVRHTARQPPLAE